MNYAITIFLVGCVMVRAASAELILVSDTTIDYHVMAGETVQIFDGPVSPTTVEIVDGARVSPSINVWGHSVLNMRAGITHSFIIGHDNSTINVFGGLVATGEDIRLFDDSVANIHGGHFGDDVVASDSGTVNLFGGTFEKAGDGASLIVQGDGVINIHLRSVDMDASNDHMLVGTLLDGSEINVGLTVDRFELRDAEIILHIIPEPSALTLAITMGFVLIFFASTRRNRRVRLTGTP